MSSVNDKCPCGSGQKYKKCCKLFHDGKLAPTALLLMKSRYSAYAFANIKYIEKTTYEIKEDLETFRQSALAFAKNTTFEKLSIKEFIDEEPNAFVTFHAKLRAEAEDISFSEKSSFLKKDGRWYYVDGVVF